MKKKQNNQNTKPKRKMKQESQSDEEDELEVGETAEDHGEKVDKDFVVNKKKRSLRIQSLSSSQRRFWIILI